MLRARGTTGGGGGQSERVKEERIKLAKARSFCSACNKKGHWRRDPECLHNSIKGQDEEPSRHPLVRDLPGEPWRREGLLHGDLGLCLQPDPGG